VAERETSGDAGYRQPRSVEELTARNVETVARLEEAAKAKRTPADRIVDGITGFCGSLTFVWVHAALFGLWVAYNLVPRVPHFDPYPFQLLAMTVSMEAIFLSTFILISQNRQGRLAERRSHLDLQINLLAEQESTKILSMLDAISKRLDVPDSDPEVSVLTGATEPQRLVAQIERTIGREGGSLEAPDR